jgi:hypothetical protein
MLTHGNQLQVKHQKFQQLKQERQQEKKMPTTLNNNNSFFSQQSQPSLPMPPQTKFPVVPCPTAVPTTV